MEVLTRTFEEELREKMIQAKKECKYNPTRFNQMLINCRTAKNVSQVKILWKKQRPTILRAGRSL